MLESEIKKLKKEIEAGRDEFTSIALKDLFALGCLLHLKGEEAAGKLACETVMKAVGFKEGIPLEFDIILKNLAGNEAQFLSDIRAHSQITRLLNSKRW